MAEFYQVTVSPTLIVTVLGMKQELVSSHPGVDDPSAFVTIASSANDPGIAKTPIEKIAKTEKSKYRILCQLPTLDKFDRCTSF